MTRWSLWVLPLALLVSACALGGIEGGPGSLPPDIVNDQLRSASGEFTFQAVVPVELEVAVNLYDPAASAASLASNAATGEGLPIYVSVVDAEGRTLYGGMFTSDGSLDTTVLVPGGMELVNMKVGTEGYEDRTVTIEDPAAYATIDRTMSLAASVAGSATAPDTDGDGVPDAYDLFPDDPDSAFALNVPAEGHPLTIAFEDNYPDLGDGDFNDFVGQYTAEEIYAPYGKQGSVVLKTIKITAWAVGHIAGYDHRFGITVDLAGKSADIVVRRYDPFGVELEPEPPTVVTGWANVVLFESTSLAASPNEASATIYEGYKTEVEISFHPAIPDLSDPRWGVELPPYDPYLYVHDTAQDVHLIGKPALPDSQNEVVFDDFRDGNGFPRGLLLPYNWPCPTEGTHIEDAYEFFDDWRLGGGLTHQDWYQHPPDWNLVEQMAFPLSDAP
jgi:LruC domain-containing protein